MVSAKLCPIVSMELSPRFPDEIDLCPCLDWPVALTKINALAYSNWDYFVDECRKFTSLAVCWWIHQKDFKTHNLHNLVILEFLVLILTVRAFCYSDGMKMKYFYWNMFVCLVKLILVIEYCAFENRQVGIFNIYLYTSTIELVYLGAK